MSKYILPQRTKKTHELLKAIFLFDEPERLAMIRLLLSKGVSKAEIARAIGISRQGFLDKYPESKIKGGGK